MALLVPIQYYGSIAIGLSDAMVACDVEQVMSQMAFRLTTAPGSQDLIFVIVASTMGWMKQWNQNYNNPLYNALEPLLESIRNYDDKSKQMSCMATGYLLGSIPDMLLNYQAPDAVFFTNVNEYEFSALAQASV